MFPVSVFSRSFLFRLVRFGLTECDLDDGAGACNLSGLFGPGKRKRPKTGQEGVSSSRSVFVITGTNNTSSIR